MQQGLAFIARHGKLGLIAGLLAGLALPDLAAKLRPWIPEMVAFLLFLTAFRIGPVEAAGGLDALTRTTGSVLVLQLLLPLGFLTGLRLLGLPLTPLAMAIALVLAAPSVTGSANFAILLGHDPAPALRLLILGTAALPLTCIPVFWLLPEFGNLSAVLVAAARLLAVILAAARVGFSLGPWGARRPSGLKRPAGGGPTVIALVAIVLPLMSALPPAMTHKTPHLAFFASPA
ncbi:MAG: hypothetical protein AB3N22_02620, partial [Ruegeria sp.]